MDRSLLSHLSSSRFYEHIDFLGSLHNSFLNKQRIASSKSALEIFVSCGRSYLIRLFNYNNSKRVRPRKCRTLTYFLASGLDNVQGDAPVSVFRLDWDPFEDLFGPGIDEQPRNFAVRSPKPRSWYGPDGQLVRELPCPSCRGRGYIVCPRCDVGTPEASCPECFGKGLKTCLQCLGERAVWEESLDEIPWEKAQSRSLLQVADDEVIDSMEIQLTPERKSNRVYSSPPLEVREKIRNALKRLDARTGSVTRRMRRIHSDPILNAKRIAAIKKAKGTEAARKHIGEKLRCYFQNPENRLKRSLRLKGVEFHCSYCGGKGHRKHYCPALPEAERKNQTPRSYRCSLCGQLGHKRTSCPTISNVHLERVLNRKKNGLNCRRYKCGLCQEIGHNARTCQYNSRMNGSRDISR